MKHSKLFLFSIFLLGGVAWAQETDRNGLAVEFPEFGTGKIKSVKSFISNANVSVVNFWVLNPVADEIEYSKVRVRINGQSAISACSQMAHRDGKVLRCDLNRFPRLRLKLNNNQLEIEATAVSGKRFYAGFNIMTDAAAARQQIAESSRSSESSVPGRSGASGRKFAVVLGVSKYKYNDVGLGNLNYADADAAALYQWLIDKGGFSPQNVLYLTNGDATLSLFRDSLTRFLSRASENDLVLFYFAGHGTPDPFAPKNLYYLVHDSKVTDLKNTGMPMTDLKRIMDENLRSKRVIFFLDTCHSAGLSNKKVVGFSRPAGGSRDLKADVFDDRQLERVDIKNETNISAGLLFKSYGRAILTSSDVNESSRESNRWGGGHGVFTWALIQGLDGNADMDRDRSISANELFEYVQNYVRKETNSKQNPRLFSSLGGDIEIVSIR